MLRIETRSATPDDVPELAKLMRLAGNGLFEAMFEGAVPFTARNADPESAQRVHARRPGGGANDRLGQRLLTLAGQPTAYYQSAFQSDQERQTLGSSAAHARNSAESA